MDPTDLINYQNAIKSIESSGGNYGLTGPATRNGDRAYGAYQVMGNNVPEWTKKHYGQELTPQQFLQNKDAQDAVFNGQFGSYVQQHGNPQDAASMWFTGRPLAQGGRASDGYITGNQYVDKFNNALGGGGGALSAIQNAAPQQGGGMPRGALSFAGGAPAADDNEDGASTTVPVTGATGRPTAGALAFNGDDGGKKDGRFSIGDLFGASDETKSRMHGIGASLVRAAAAASAGVNPAQSAQLNALGKSLEEQNKTDYQYMMGPNGQLVKINKDTGAVNFATLPGGGAQSFTPHFGKDASGNDVYKGRFNAKTGEWIPAGGANGPPQGPSIGGDPNLEGEERLASMSPEDRRMAIAFHEGRGPPVTSLSLRNPKFSGQWAGAQAAFPGLDVNTAAARKKFLEGKSTSNPTSYGGLIQRSEIALDQLDKTLDSYGKLGNTDSKLGVTAAKAENYLTSGGTAKGKIYQELKTNSSNAASDINSVQNGGRGTGAEREHIASALNLPYDSHVVQSGAVQAHLDALKSAIDARFHSEKAQVGEDFLMKDPDYVRLKKKLDDAQAKADKLHQGDFTYVGGKAAAAKAPEAAKPAAVPSSWDEAQKSGWK